MISLENFPVSFIIVWSSSIFIFPLFYFQSFNNMTAEATTLAKRAYTLTNVALIFPVFSWLLTLATFALRTTYSVAQLKPEHNKIILSFLNHVWPILLFGCIFSFCLLGFSIFSFRQTKLEKRFFYSRIFLGLPISFSLLAVIIYLPSL